jgi:hypothetical protein
MALPLGAVMALGAGGCSLIATQSVPPNDGSRPFVKCTTSYVPGAIDTAMAIVTSIGVTVIAVDPNASNRATKASFGLLADVLWIASAAGGIKNASDCEDAKALEAERRPAAPRPGPRRPPVPAVVRSIPAVEPPREEAKASGEAPAVAAPPVPPAPAAPPPPVGPPSPQQRDDDGPPSK